MSNCPVTWPTSATGRNSRPFFSKNSPAPSGWTESKFSVSPDSFSASAALAALVEFRRRGLHDGEDRAVLIEGLVELIIALAPIQIGRDQRVDVGVDGEVPGRIEARRYRKNECDQNSKRGKPRAGFDNRDNNTCQHIFSF